MSDEQAPSPLLITDEEGNEHRGPRATASTNYQERSAPPGRAGRRESTDTVAKSWLAHPRIPARFHGGGGAEVAFPAG